MSITFSKEYGPPNEGKMSGMGMNGLLGREEFYGARGIPNAEMSARLSFYGMPDVPKLDMTALRKASLGDCGFCEATDQPSRALWFLIGAAAVITWPVVQNLLTFVPRKNR